MNKKISMFGFLSAVVASAMIFTSSASAFWPFDAIFGKGEVKAVTTEAKPLFAAPGNDVRAQALFNTLKTMNMACKDVQLVATNNRRTTPVKTMAGNTVANQKLKPSPTVNPREIDAIYSSLALKCKEIQSLSDRLTRVYKGGEASPTPSRLDTKVTPKAAVTKAPYGGIFNLRNKKAIEPKPVVKMDSEENETE